MSKNITIILASAGPKPILEVSDGQSLLEYQVEILRKVFRNPEIIVVIGYQADKISKYIQDDIKIVENERFEETASTRSISMGMRVSFNKNLLIIHGDVFFDENSIRKINYGDASKLLICNKSFNEEAVGVNIYEDKVIRLAYSFENKWGHILYIDEKDHALFTKLFHNKMHRKYYTFETINKAIDAGAELKPFYPKNTKIFEINSYKDIDKCNQI